MPDQIQNHFPSGPDQVTVGLGDAAVRVRVARMSVREGEREALAMHLVPGWPESGRVGHDDLGRPLAAVPGFFLSFSRLHRPETGSLTYGAACGDGGGAVLGLGIDAARAAEFGVTYPRERVFTNAELTLLRSRFSVVRGGSEVLALAWACKEAAVKALGVGFHHCEPRDVVGVDCHTQGDMFGVRMRAACRNRHSDVDCVAWIEAGSWIVVGLARASGPKELACPGPGS